jgi:glycosyltransferase involved in cell wall biosynthesis
MKIMFANKYFFRNGGSENVMFDEIAFMRNANVDVVEFAMDDPRNIPSRYSHHFVSEKSYNSPSRVAAVTSAVTFIHSQEAVRKLTDFIRVEKPDILHCHNIYHQLTPSIIPAAVRLRIPVVLTLHDLKTICPIYTQPAAGDLCTACSEDRFKAVVKNRCASLPLGKRVLLWAEASYHLAKGSYEHVTKVIAPSRFLQNAVTPRFGTDKVVQIPNGIDLTGIDIDDQPDDGEFVLYFGRLSPEKGVETLLQAHAEDAGAWRLVVAGTGPLMDSLKSRFPSAEFTGHLTGPALRKRIGAASVVVAPSECQENAPLSVIEAMAHAKPIVASRVGGIPELVRHGETGFLFQPKERREFSRRVRDLMGDRELRRRFGFAGRRVVELEYSLERHGSALLSLYGALVGGFEAGASDDASSRRQASAARDLRLLVRH